MLQEILGLTKGGGGPTINKAIYATKLKGRQTEAHTTAEGRLEL